MEEKDKSGKEVKEVKEKEAKLNISPSELIQLIDSMVTKSNEKLVDALLESRKPYRKPEDIQNEEAMRASFRKMEDAKRKNLAQQQAACPHMQGSNLLSEETGDRTSIIWHRLDTGIWFGLCTNCQRQFWPEDEDYREWWAKKSGNRKSQAGQRDWLPADAAILGR